MFTVSHWYYDSYWYLFSYVPEVSFKTSYMSASGNLVPILVQIRLRFSFPFFAFIQDLPPLFQTSGIFIFLASFCAEV